MRRPVTAAEMEELFARNLPDRQFRRAVYALEHGADALRLLDLQVRRDQAAELYRDAMNAALLRGRDGSLERQHVETLMWAFRRWRDAVSVAAEFESRRRVPAAAE